MYFKVQKKGGGSGNKQGGWQVNGLVQKGNAYAEIWKHRGQKFHSKVMKKGVSNEARGVSLCLISGK